MTTEAEGGAWIEVKNHHQFQHYRDRNPPWIKLYGSTFNDCAFTELPDASKLLLIGLWVLASRTRNHTPLKPKWITSQLSLTERLDLQPLVDAGFIIIHKRAASGLLTSRQQDVALSREEGEGQLQEEKSPEVIRNLVLESLRSSTGREAKTMPQ
jgi:hypothetical protein